MTSSDVEELRKHLGHPGFTQDQADRAQQLLDDAMGVIVREVGQPLDQSTDTVTLDADGGCELVLPRWPVTAVTSVSVKGSDGTFTALAVDTDYEWSQAGILTRVGGFWPRKRRSVAVVFTAGYPTLSADVKRIRRRLAAAGWFNPAGADAENLDDHQVKWNTPGMELTSGEIRQLEPYGRRP